MPVGDAGEWRVARVRCDAMADGVTVRMAWWAYGFTYRNYVGGLCVCVSQTFTPPVCAHLPKQSPECRDLLVRVPYRDYSITILSYALFIL